MPSIFSQLPSPLFCWIFHQFWWKTEADRKLMWCGIQNIESCFSGWSWSGPTVCVWLLLLSSSGDWIIHYISWIVQPWTWTETESYYEEWFHVVSDYAVLFWTRLIISYEKFWQFLSLKRLCNYNENLRTDLLIFKGYWLTHYWDNRLRTNSAIFSLFHKFDKKRFTTSWVPFFKE